MPNIAGLMIRELLYLTFSIPLSLPLPARTFFRRRAVIEIDVITQTSVLDTLVKIKQQK